MLAEGYTDGWGSRWGGGMVCNHAAFVPFACGVRSARRNLASLSRVCPSLSLALAAVVSINQSIKLIGSS